MIDSNRFGDSADNPILGATDYKQQYTTAKMAYRV
jgi:hypothetical protein